MLFDEAREHIGDQVLRHAPSDAVGEFRIGVVSGVPGNAEDRRVLVRFEGRGRDSDACADHLTLLRGSGAREHFCLALADAGFPVAGHAGTDFP